MDVSCKRCQTTIQAEDINLDRMVAKCRSCHAVFHFEPAPSHKEQHQAPSERTRRRPKELLPAGISLEEEEGGFTIVRRWFNATFLFLIVFCLLWNGFLVVWYSIAFSSEILLMALFPILHVAVGVGLSYYTLAGLLNRTRISVKYTRQEPIGGGPFRSGEPSNKAGILSIRHAPLPWFGQQEIKCEALEQIYCKEKIQHNKNGTSRSYEVHAILKNNLRITLLKSLPKPEQALFIEQELEERLKIQDQRVPGEFSS